MAASKPTHIPWRPVDTGSSPSPATASPFPTAAGDRPCWRQTLAATHAQAQTPNDCFFFVLRTTRNRIGHFMPCRRPSPPTISRTYHRVSVFDQFVLGHIVDFLRLLEQVAQEVLQLVRLNVTAVVAVVFAPDLRRNQIIKINGPGFGEKFLFLRAPRSCKSYLHKLNAGFERIVETEEQQKILLHGQQLGQLCVCVWLFWSPERI